MFQLSLLEHQLRLPPHLFGLPLPAGIKRELENIFLDKVIPDLGLCISIYDIKKFDGGLVSPGDGAPTYMVRFRIVVFRPFPGEVIVAKLKESDDNGLRLSLGFFEDVYIPSRYLPMPKSFVADPEGRYKGIWSWDFGGEHDKFIIDGLDEIKFRVESLEFPPIPLEQQGKPFAPMIVQGNIDADGLGPVSWW